MLTLVLLVEGQGDVDFFTALLQKLDFPDKISIQPPKEFGMHNNTVTYFPTVINTVCKRMRTDTDEKTQNFGIIADADYVSGGGFKERWKTLTKVLQENGYHTPEKPPTLPYTGSIFEHNDGLSPVGLWLMPDHKHNGMLEDFILKTISKEEQRLLLKSAEHSLKNLPVTLFSKYHHSKAMIHTWLAWQKRPGQTLQATINSELINLDSDEMKGFINWLHQVFS
ncbi:MAG: hypothetical protein KAH77_06930 [Thiomargarita sp.]|nr:hypothetical protein [Thiomargarita sp.]